MVVGAMRLQQTSDDESLVPHEQLERQRMSLPRVGIVLAIVGAIGLVGVLALTGSSVASLHRGRFGTIISKVEESTEAPDEESTEAPSTAAPTQAPDEESTAAPTTASGDDDDDGEEDKQDEDVNYLSEECKGKFTSVFDELTEAYNDFLSKCEGVDTSGSPEDLPEACSTAIDTYWSKHDNMPDFKGGKCIHEDFMECQVEQVINGTDFSHKACMPKVCKPLNMVMNGIHTEKESGLCDGAGADCSLTVECAGHDKVTKAMADEVAGRKSAAPGKSVGLAMVVLATAFSF